MAFVPMGYIPGVELERRLLRHMLQSRAPDPMLSGSEDLGKWFSAVESACRQCAVPPTQYTDAGITLINDTSPLLLVMQERRRVYLETTHEAFWPWAKFKVVTEAEVLRLNPLTLGQAVLVTLILGGLLSLFMGGPIAACIASIFLVLSLIGSGAQILSTFGNTPWNIPAAPMPVLAVDADEPPAGEVGD